MTMKWKKGFTLPEMLITVGVLSVVSLIVFMIFNQVSKTGNQVRDAAMFQVQAAKALGIVMKDMQSMSFVMTLQRNFVPIVQGGSHPQTKQTFQLTNTLQASQLDSSVVKLNDSYLQFNRSDYNYPHNQISFSIGLSDADYRTGITTTNVNHPILVNYFLWRRDDDGDGKYQTSSTVSEDKEADGIDNDSDGLDGEEPEDEGLIVGYQVTYTIVERSRRVKSIGGKTQYLKYCDLIRTEYRPHNGQTKKETLLSNVVLFSILPFKSEGSVRQLITANDLKAIWDSGTSKYVYGSAISHFRISFEVTLSVADPNGKVYTFQRVFTPMIFSAIEA